MLIFLSGLQLLLFHTSTRLIEMKILPLYVAREQEKQLCNKWLKFLAYELNRPKLKCGHIMEYMKTTTLFYSFLLIFISKCIVICTFYSLSDVSPIFYRMFPFEALHTLPLGPAKHLLREEMPLLSKGQKAEILARLKAFHTSGFSVKLYGNVCYYYQSFCGRDFKAWVQMALFIIGPYLNDGELAVWKSFCKVMFIIFLFLSVYVYSTRCS